jgi:hypothetical protein
MREVDPQRILDAAIAGVRANSLSPEAAASGVETIFEAAALYNNTMFGGFRRVGLDNQVTYNTQIKRPATLVEQLKVGAKAGLGLFGPIATPQAIIGAGLEVITGKPTEFTEAQLEKQRAGLAKTFSVDMMDGTRVQEAIVRLLTSTKPPETTPINEK